LFGGQPVAQPDTQSLYAFDAADSSRQVGAEETTICRLVRQTPNCAEPEVDRAGRQMSRFKMHSIANDNRLVECESWLGAIPIHELVDGMSIAPLRIGTRQTGENRGLGDF
jgi:hypothetical protein